MMFPVGYHRLHPDTSLNFQMNRWSGCVGEPGMREEMGAAAPRIASYADWTREFVALAEGASEQGHVLRAGFYWRSAECFMRADDSARENARARFLGAMQSGYGTELGERFAVPYYHDGQLIGQLPAYRFTPSRARGTIVIFGGFDSYIEEMTSAFLYLRDAGYDVIAFDGPGQGRALHDGRSARGSSPRTSMPGTTVRWATRVWRCARSSSGSTGSRSSTQRTYQEITVMS